MLFGLRKLQPAEQAALCTHCTEPAALLHSTGGLSAQQLVIGRVKVNITQKSFSDTDKYSRSGDPFAMNYDVTQCNSSDFAK